MKQMMQSLKNNIGKIILFLLLVITIVWLVISKVELSQEKKNSKEKDDLIDQLSADITKKLIDRKLKYEKDSARYQHNIDSLSRVYNALENSRKSDFKFYQNKLNELKKINTYSERQHYADSLAGTR